MLGLDARRLTFILILIVAVFASSQYAPAYFYALQFKDFIRQEVKFAGTSRKSIEDVMRDILDQAKEYDIPVTAKDIRVTRRGPSFTLDLDFHFPIDLRVYHHDVIFHASETGESFQR